MRLRRATEEDGELLFAWANDPVTRANSATTDAIPWEAHAEWFAGKLRDPASAMFVALEGDEPVGVVRFDVWGNEAEISVNLAPPARGRGVGALVIRHGCAQLFAERDVPVVAYIREENAASQKAFESAGFEPAGRRVVRGVEMLRFVKTG